MAALADADRDLVEHATAVCRETFDPEFFDGAHVVTASLRTAEGVYDGVSLPASIGRASVCGEPGAVSAAVADRVAREDFEAIVAVAAPLPSHDTDEIRVIPPCGVCREMLVDYAPEMRVVVPEDDEGGPLEAVAAESLLPGRTW
jgi:cytidine deaminase